MSNRAARRAEKKKKPAYMRNLTAYEIQKRFVQQGISPKDLEEEYRRGYSAGWREAGNPVVKGVYAAVCLVMHEMHGFGRKRCRDLLCAIDQNLLYQLTTEEAIDEVWNKIGLKLEFDEALDRIVEV